MTTHSNLRWRIRAVFLTFIGGALAYAWLALQGPGTTSVLEEAGLWGVILVVGVGSALGGAATWLWHILQQQGHIPTA